MGTQRILLIALGVVCVVLLVVCPRPSAIASSLIRGGSAYFRNSFFSTPDIDAASPSDADNASALSSGNPLVTLARPKLCKHSFLVPRMNGPKRQLCFVMPPPKYAPPQMDLKRRLWFVRLSNLGKLDRKNPDFGNQVKRQRWARFGDEYVELRSDGGTSVRNFKDNFVYAHIILNVTARLGKRRCEKEKSTTPIMMLDTGAGVGTVAAAMQDERGANGKVRVLSYVPVDTYLRLGAIIADRGLPAFLHFFNGSRTPLPDASFDIVHCRWCWHHLAGYDAWLREVHRLLVSGGHFVFSFVPERDQRLLPRKEWKAALRKMKTWTCFRSNRTMTVCRKSDAEPPPANTCTFNTDLRNLSERSKHDILTAVQNDARLAYEKVNEIGYGSYSRVLNINCNSNLASDSGASCWKIEQAMKDKGVDVVFHTFRRRNEDSLKKTILAGGSGIIHEWFEQDGSINAGPFYPRSFDVVHVACEKGEEHIMKNINLFIEVHRLLRTGGILMLMRSTCPASVHAIPALKKSLFKVAVNIDDLVIAQRLNV